MCTAFKTKQTKNKSKIYQEIIVIKIYHEIIKTQKTHKICIGWETKSSKGNNEWPDSTYYRKEKIFILYTTHSRGEKINKHNSNN